MNGFDMVSEKRMRQRTAVVEGRTVKGVRRVAFRCGCTCYTTLDGEWVVRMSFCGKRASCPTMRWIIDEEANDHRPSGLYVVEAGNVRRV